MSSTKEQARAEWRSHWPLVMACAFGFALSTVLSYSLGLFMDPMTSELGWNRAQISAGLTISGLSGILLSPFFGVLLDRWGARRLALPGIVLTTIAVASFSLAQSVPHWLMLWLFYALVAAGVRLQVWTSAVSNAFAAGRGLAIAATLCGTAIAGILVPPMTNWLIDTVGWRLAFVLLSTIWGAVALLLSFFFLFEPRYSAARKGADPAAARLPRASLPGLSVAEALRSKPLWMIGISSFLYLLFLASIIIHLVPVMIDLGVTRGTAAALASLTAVAGFFGKIVTGLLMDRMHAGRISGLTLASAAIGFALLLIEPIRSLPVIALGMIIIGYSGGAKIQVTAYLTGRYGGLRNFGKIFGMMSSIIAMGSAIGPVMAGAIFDHFGSYRYFLMAGIPISLVSGMLIFPLGPYPTWDDEPGDS